MACRSDPDCPGQSRLVLSLKLKHAGFLKKACSFHSRIDFVVSGLSQEDFESIKSLLERNLIFELFQNHDFEPLPSGEEGRFCVR